MTGSYAIIHARTLGDLMFEVNSLPDNCELVGAPYQRTYGIGMTEECQAVITRPQPPIQSAAGGEGVGGECKGGQGETPKRKGGWPKGKPRKHQGG